MGTRRHGAGVGHTRLLVNCCCTVSRLGRSLKWVFEIDLEHDPNCDGVLKAIAAILEAPVIERILPHLGLQARAPARGHMQQAA